MRHDMPRQAVCALAVIAVLSGCQTAEDPGAAVPTDRTPVTTPSTETVTLPAPSEVTRTAVTTVTATTTVTVAEPDPDPPGPVAEPDPDPPGPTDEAPFGGTWSGVVDQPGSGSYTVRVTLSGTSDLVAGVVEYPELGCGGRWEMFEVSDGAYLFTEHIAYGGRCVDGVEISIAPSSGLLDYRTLPPYESSAALTPDSGGPVEDRDSLDAAELGWPTDRDDASGAMYAWFGAAWRAGQSTVGFPAWTSCTEGVDLCLAGGGATVGVIQRGGSGFHETHTIPADQPARASLLDLGFTEAQINALLD